MMQPILKYRDRSGWMNFVWFMVASFNDDNFGPNSYTEGIAVIRTGGVCLGTMNTSAARRIPKAWVFV